VSGIKGTHILRPLLFFAAKKGNPMKYFQVMTTTTDDFVDELTL